MDRLAKISSDLNVEPLMARHRVFALRTGGEYPAIPEAPVGANRPRHEAVGRVKRIALSKEQEELCEVMGIKAGYLARQMYIQGIHIEAALKAGINPFNDEAVRPRYMRSVCSMLLEGGFTKRELKERLLRDNPDWDSRTASNHVSTVVACLMTVRAINKVGQRFTI